MAVSHVEAVLEFLRKNGFSEAESALKVDMIEKADLGSFDYEKFLFPMVPPPPPVRIPATTSRSEPLLARDSSRSSPLSSDDEFVSLGSSTSEVCSSGTLGLTLILLLLGLHWFLFNSSLPLMSSC